MISLPKNTILSVARSLVSLIRYTKTQFTAIECLVFVCILPSKMRLFEQGPITPNVLILEQTNYSYITWGGGGGGRRGNSHRLGYGMCHFLRVLSRLKNKFLGLFYGL